MPKNTSNRTGFREYCEENDLRPKKKRVDESQKQQMRFKEKLRKLDPKNLSEDDFDDDYYNTV